MQACRLDAAPYVPAAHCTHACCPLLAMALPFWHGRHTDWPGVGCTVPGAQALQLDMPPMPLYVPAAQGRHDAVPFSGAYAPGEQAVQPVAPCPPE